MKHPQTPDGRYMVVRGRLWRVANPHLSTKEREALVSALMAARRQVEAAMAAGDPDELAAARSAVNAAKMSLGERGPVWWHDGAKDFNRHLVKNTPYRLWYEQLVGPQAQQFIRDDAASRRGSIQAPGLHPAIGDNVKGKLKTTISSALFAAITPAIASAAVVAMPADVAFQKASAVLVGLDAIPTFRDKDLLVIKTDPVQVRLTPDQADCGKMFGIPYLKDKRTKTAATYQVVIKPIDGDTSDVSVKVTLDGYMDVNEGAPFFIEKTRDKNKVLTCSSNGWLESRFIEALQAP